jgi:hypothetical protein
MSTIINKDELNRTISTLMLFPFQQLASNVTTNTILNIQYHLDNWKKYSLDAIGEKSLFITLLNGQNTEVALNIMEESCIHSLYLSGSKLRQFDKIPSQTVMLLN